MEPIGGLLNFTWTPGNSGDCTFLEWQLQWRYWGAETWSPSNCSQTHSAPVCAIELLLGSAIEVAIREACVEPRAFSPWLTSAAFRWLTLEHWEVYVAPSTSLVDVMAEPGHVALRGATSSSFSLCVDRMVSITSSVGSWSEPMWLLCYFTAPSLQFDPPTLPDPMLVASVNASGALLDISYQAATDLESCRCGAVDLELRATNYSTPFGYAAEELWAPSSCSGLSLSSRSCSALLRPDASYEARAAVGCLDGRSNYSLQSFVSAPICKWVTSSGYAELYECIDGSLCNTTSCCNGHLGRARCPMDLPVMCERNLDCAEGQDRCCMATADGCAAHSGVRPCFQAEVHAKAPVILNVTSLQPGELYVTWSLSSYLNGHRSRCSFSYWRLELSLGDGVWLMASECVDQDRGVTSCLVRNLATNANYSVRLREGCTRTDYDSDWALWPLVATLPQPALPPAVACLQATQQGDAMQMQVAWTAGAKNDCVFEAWEVDLQLSSWTRVCSSSTEQDVSCLVSGLQSGRYYNLRMRQVCDNGASSDYALLSGMQCLVTAMPAASPVNLTASSLTPYEIEVLWAPQHPWACVFQSWQVQVKRQADDQWGSFGCYSYERDVSNCTVNVGLGSNTPYDVRVRETCQDGSLNSTWRTLAYPGVSTPLPSKAGTPTGLQVSKVSAFLLRLTWTPGADNDCVFASWDVQLIGSTVEVLSCSSPCEVVLSTLTVTDGSYHVRVGEICSDPLANSETVQQDAAIQLAASAASVSGLSIQDAGETWMKLNWVTELTSCSQPVWQVHWRLLSMSYSTTYCSSLPCNVSGLRANSAYEVLVEEACDMPWSVPSILNESSTFWTLPGEWSTFIGNSHSYTVAVTLASTPHRCYVQKECCSDEFFVCHGSDRRSVSISRSDVPGGWGQSVSLVCVQPALSTISLKPQVQATGPASLLLAPRDNESVTIIYPLKMAGSLQGCECPEIVLQLAVQGSNQWQQTGGLCSAWNSRECIVDGLSPGTTYEGRAQIQCRDTALNSAWTVAGATVTTNLEALVVEGSLSVIVQGRRLASSSGQLRETLAEVTQLPLRSVLVESVGGSDWRYTLAASAVGQPDADTNAAEVESRLSSSLEGDFQGRLSARLGPVTLQVLQAPETSRRSEAFKSCSVPPSVANAAVNWTGQSCLGRTWSDPPCAVPCDVGFLPEGSGFLCGVDGDWSSVPRCASLWTVTDWGPCLGAPGDCGDGGLETRQVRCPEASCHSMSKPIEERACRASAGCYWVTGAWTACSTRCGAGWRSRSISCSGHLCEQTVPAHNESCSDWSGCQWQVEAWSSCSSTCGVGTQTRAVTCEAEPSYCPSPAPALVQYCQATSGCRWQTSDWSSCSNSCGRGVAVREVWCSGMSEEDCAGARPDASVSCYDTVGCRWQMGPWSSCNSSCGLGRRTRSLECPSGQAVDCPGPQPASAEDCYETSACVWQTSAWSSCDVTCGAGARLRAVTCSSGLDVDCASSKPHTAEPCYDVVGCAWQINEWSSCSASCGPGVRSRSVTCPSGWPADCAALQAEPASTESCRGTACDWSIGAWSECSNDCGDGTRVRSVRCSSGEDMDCLAARPISEESCRVTSGCGWTLGAWGACDVACGAGLQRRSAVCASGLPSDCPEQPVVIQNCYATEGCLWQTGSFGSCSSSCGAGVQTRPVTCSSGRLEDCVASRPMATQGCYEQAGCRWQSGAWSACSETCGQGLRTRQVWCDSHVDADCIGENMPSRSESCYETSSCIWSAGLWSECSTDCGDGIQERSVTCSGASANDCAAVAPESARACRSVSNCAWQTLPWQPCNVSCGIGWQQRSLRCPSGLEQDCPEKRPLSLQWCYAQEGCFWELSSWSTCSGSCEPGTRQRNVTCSSKAEADCSQVPRPVDQEACNEAATGCRWVVGPWEPCSATGCGQLGSRVRDVQCPSRFGEAGCPGTKPRQLEVCLSDATCEWQIGEWSACDASCGWGEASRMVTCSGEGCGEKPQTVMACYSTTGCQWWTGQWSDCNSSCGAGYQNRSLVCGAESCDPSTAPPALRECHGSDACDWQSGTWGDCSSSCGEGIVQRVVECPSGRDADCWTVRPMDRKSCRNVTGCQWSTSAWSVCSSSCGDGSQMRSVVCPSGHDSDCGTPLPSLRPCVGRFCGWNVGLWSNCSAGCGVGQRQRHVQCPVAGACNGTRPSEAEPCVGACGFVLGAWSTCSAACGWGLQRRSVDCVNASSCTDWPAAEQACVGSQCSWTVGAWSNCTEGCGVGTRQRTVSCPGVCSSAPPNDRETCDALRSRSSVGASCGWTTGPWSLCGADCGPRTREVSCPVRCFGKRPVAVEPCEENCAEAASARFELSLLLEDVSILPELMNGTRQAVARVMKVPVEDVQVSVSESLARRLSTRLTVQVEVTSSRAEIAMLSLPQGQELLHSELLETWDQQGLPLDQLSVHLGSPESATTLPEEVEPSRSGSSASNLLMLVVLGTLCCSIMAGAAYCWRWRSGKVSPLQLPSCPSPGGDSLKSPAGGASPAAVSHMRKLAQEPQAPEATQVEVARAVQVRVVQAGEALPRAVRLPQSAVRMQRARTEVSPSSRSPLSNPPRPGDMPRSAGSARTRWDG